MNLILSLILINNSMKTTLVIIGVIAVIALVGVAIGYNLNQTITWVM